MSQGESTTDAHETKGRRKAPHPATWPTVIATVLSAGLTGTGFGLVRRQDIDRMESRIDKVEIRASAVEMTVVELKADSRNQDRKLDDIKATLDGLRLSIDAMRDRMPR